MPYKDPEKEKENRKIRGLRYYRNHVGTIIRKKSIQNASRKYGISKEKVIEIWTSPCSLCGLDPEATGVVSQVDHNHKTGEVRGPLCQRCNNFVGYLEHISQRKLIFILRWLGLKWMGVE